jgi:hypothetical protein
VVVDRQGLVREANLAFVQLVHAADLEAVIGQPLERWLPGAAMANLRSLHSHGLAPTQRVMLVRGDEQDLAVDLAGALLDDVGGGDAGFTLRPSGPHVLTADARAAELLRAIHALAAELGGSPLPDLLREAQALTQQHFVHTALDRHPGDAPAAARLLGITIDELAQLRRQPGFTAPPPTR